MACTRRPIQVLLASCCIVLLSVIHSARPTAGNTAASTATAAAANASQPLVATQTSDNKTAAPTTASATTATTTTTTTTTTTATTRAATTTAMQKPTQLCKFPFWHRGEWRHECLPYGSKGAHWCSLTGNFTRDEEWRDCARYDLMRYKCSVPFHHQGKTHNQCQPLQLEPLAEPVLWCALVPVIASVSWVNLGTDWTFCETANATGSDYLRAVGGYHNLADAEFHKALIKTSLASANANKSGNSSKTNGTAAAATFAHAQEVDASKSVAAATDGSSAGSAGDATTVAAVPSSLLGVALAIVGVILAAVAVAAAFAVHRRNQYKRIDPLLSAEPASEKSTYGGMQAYHD